MAPTKEFSKLSGGFARIFEIQRLESGVTHFKQIDLITGGVVVIEAVIGDRCFSTTFSV